MEDDIAQEDKRRIRGLVRQTAAEIDNDSAKSHDRAHRVKQTEVANSLMDVDKKGQRKQWDVVNISSEYKTNDDESSDANKKFGRSEEPAALLSVEVFIVSRIWQLDQGRLLRALDRIKCATISRIQVRVLRSFHWILNQKWCPQ